MCTACGLCQTDTHTHTHTYRHSFVWKQSSPPLLVTQTQGCYGNGTALYSQRVCHEDGRRMCLRVHRWQVWNMRVEAGRGRWREGVQFARDRGTVSVLECMHVCVRVLSSMQLASFKCHYFQTECLVVIIDLWSVKSSRSIRGQS